MSLSPKLPLEEAIIELYLNVKVRSNDEISKYDASTFENEKQKLREVDPHTVLDYIKSSIEILMSLKSEEHAAAKRKKITKFEKAKDNHGFEEENSDMMSMTSQSLCSTLEKFKEGPPHEYEEAIQKLEGDVRMHIRVEQQMRLHIENLQQKIEDLERENANNIKKIKTEFKDLKDEKKRLNELLNLKGNFYFTFI